MKQDNNLTVEFNQSFVKATSTFKHAAGIIAVTPPIDENYWLFRVHLHKDQYVQAFPKFFTLGIGFALEDDWNTNLPYSSDGETIYNHIEHNKKYKQITKEQAIEAITKLSAACAEYYAQTKAKQN